MERVSFLVNRGENDCLMAHGVEWAAYVEAANMAELAESVMTFIRRDFQENERPNTVDFLFFDGKIISLCA